MLIWGLACNISDLLAVEILYRAYMVDKETKKVVPIFGIEHYSLKNNNNTDTNLSKMSFQFYKDGKHFDYFFEKIMNFYEKRCRGDTDFDYLALVPTHTGKLNEHMVQLCKKLSSALNIPVNFDIIKRTKEAKLLHETKEKEKRMKINEETLEINIDIKDKNILILDNTSTSGSTAQTLFHKLKNRGANEVIFIVLGLGAKFGTISDFDLNSTLKGKLSDIIKRFHGLKITEDKRTLYKSKN